MILYGWYGNRSFRKKLVEQLREKKNKEEEKSLQAVRWSAGSFCLL